MTSPSLASGQSLRSRLGAGGGRLGLIAAIAAAVLLVDLATKALAVHGLSGGGRSEILGGLVTLDLYRNFAGPNDILTGHTTLISLFAIVAVLVLVGVSLRVSSRTSAIAVGLLLGGAMGNLLDRLLREPGPLRGGVVDWFRLTDLTNLMNLADLAINAAVAVILVAASVSWWRSRGEEEGGPARGERLGGS